jgi:hypothetical protein
MALFVFAAIYFVAAGVYLVVTGLAIGARARAFKAVSPGMLPPLGIIFGLLVGFVAVQVWNDFDRAKVAVINEASALRGVVLFSETFPEPVKLQLRRLINRHIDGAVKQEWGAMSEQRLTLATLPSYRSAAGNAGIEAGRRHPKDGPARNRQRIATGPG